MSLQAEAANIASPLARLFAPGDLVFTCGPIRPGLGPTHSGIATLETPPCADDVFFAINALKDTSARKSENVATFRNFLLEIDTLSLDQQREILTLINGNIPVAMATFSGGKSIHMIISLIDELPAHETPVQYYKTVWKALAATLEQFLDRSGIFDRACQDPARLSRLPGGHEPGRAEQALIHTGNFISAEHLLAEIGEHLRPPRAGLPPAAENPNMTVGRFEQELRGRMSLANLRMRFTVPQIWAADAGMYGELFRLSLWAIDATGVPKETLLCYLEQKVFPVLRAAGYTRDLERPVLNAYEHKQG